MKIIAVIIAALISAPLIAQTSGLKVGVINSELIMQSYPEFRRIEAQLGRVAEDIQKDRTSWEGKMQNLQEQVDELLKRLELGQNTLNETRKAALRSEVDSLRMQLNSELTTRATEEQERFNRQRDELLAGVYQIINEAIEEIGEQNNFDFIIDAANGTVVYARDPEDINDLLLQQLEKK